RVENGGQDGGRTALPRLLLNPDAQTVLFEAIAQPACLTACDLIGQAGDGAEAGYRDGSSFEEVKRLDLRRGLQESVDLAAAAWIKTRSRHLQTQAQANCLKIRAPGDVEEVEAGT